MLPLGVLAASGSGAAGAYELISTTLLSSSQSSVTFSSISANYTHLQLRATLRADRSGAVSEIYALRVNSDSTANYSAHVLLSNGSSVTSTAYTGETYIRGAAYPGAGDTADLYGAFILDILDYAQTNTNKQTRFASGRVGSGGTYDVSLRSGSWRSTNAITSLTLVNFFGSNFVAGSRFSLYGIKGA